MIEITCRFTGRVLYSYDGDNVKMATEAAVAARAYLARANLGGAYLVGANLVGANLVGANLRGADLVGANLGGADLRGADLVGANLGGADLGGADLAGAYLVGANLVGANLRGADLDGGEVAAGERPVLQIGPVGSRSAYLVAWITRNGVFIRAGCFWGTRDQFAEKVKETHGDGVHAQEYEAALALIDAHARLWAPARAESEGG